MSDSADFAILGATEYDAAVRKQRRCRRVLVTAVAAVLAVVVVVVVAVVFATKHDSSDDSSDDRTLDLDLGTYEPGVYDDLSDENRRLMDTSVAPCDDFYMHACGGWLRTKKRNTDPIIVRAFTMASHEVDHIIDTLLSSRGGDDDATNVVQRSYALCRDIAARDARGVAWIKPLIDAVDADIRRLDGDDALPRAQRPSDVDTFNEARRHRRNFLRLLGRHPAVFKFTMRGATTMRLELNGVTKPALYANDAAFGVYQGILNSTYQTIGYDVDIADSMARAGMRIERQVIAAITAGTGKTDSVMVGDWRPGTEQYSWIATAAYPHLFNETYVRVVAPNPYYNVTQQTPLLFRDIIDDAGAELFNSSIITVNIADKTAMKAFDTIVAEMTVDDIVAYAQMMTVIQYIPTTTTSMYASVGRMYTDLFGLAEAPPLASLCKHHVKTLYPTELAHMFGVKMFPDENRAFVNDLLDHVTESLRTTIQRSSWLDAVTRARAEDKLRKIRRHVGMFDATMTPARLRAVEAAAEARFVAGDWSATVEAGRRAVKAELVRSAIVSYPFNSDKKPCLQGDSAASPAFGSSPFYCNLDNTINFPVAELVPPLLDMQATPTHYFGGLAWIGAHELTHAFDTTGAYVNGDGKVGLWYTKSSATAFGERAKCFVRQYGERSVMRGELDGLKVDGEKTLRENIADNGALNVMTRAYVSFMRARQQTPNVKLLYLSMVQQFCTLTDPATMRVQQADDTHAPWPVRMQTVLQNYPGFARVFGCRAGDAMAPPASDRCVIWGA